MNSFDSENNNRSSQVQTNGILPTKPTIASFLEELKLTKYISTFNDQDVDFGTLLTLNDGDLKEVGISLFGPRRKILSALSRWKEENDHSNNASDSKAMEKLQHQALQTEQLQKQLDQEKDLRLVAEGCLMEEKAKRQEIYIRVCNVKELWKQVKGEVETLKALCQEMAEGNCDLSQEEVHSKLESSVVNLGNSVSARHKPALALFYLGIRIPSQEIPLNPQAIQVPNSATPSSFEIFFNLNSLRKLTSLNMLTLN
ncbi:Ankyrin repeat and SAM domain-containing protein 3 [Desmophyllum pertusum]|uniref:Ankyrin repeat and SAM domain-containing protein 3 n=1 Tax=Desmophyllum pertusum TaxID=174260 RepID=A0A9W9YX94_9CNID|nr:Ankyrin repeat and SAM domain-containing protein 3 [Desmophyllum pertusum]